MTARLNLSDVTLCAVSGYLVSQTLDAMRRSAEIADFGDKFLITDRAIETEIPNDVRIITGVDLSSREKYSRVVQECLGEHVGTSHAMIVQWDGYPVRPENWTDAFLDFDYIGAPWPQFESRLAVGNGGFSLRSRRLLQACKHPRFQMGHPEDLNLCHRNRSLLEGELGIRFAPIELAERFSYERSGDSGRAFGFHGLFNMPREMGLSAFLDFFAGLDRSSIGLRELRDVSDILWKTPGGRRAARAILWDSFRAHWHDHRFWRFEFLRWRASGF